MKKEQLKWMTIAEINALYSPEKVARKLIKETVLYGQEIAAKPTRSEAEKRHAMTVGRLARILAADRRAA